MDAFHVVIDTSVLRQAHFQHPDFKRLLRFSQRGLIKIYIPYIVLEEERTHRMESLVESMDKIQATVQRLTDGGSAMLVQGLPAPIVEIWTRQDVERNSRLVYEKFLSDNKIELIATTHHQAESVLRRYFGTQPPFDPTQQPRTKRREHIPDAWILEAALEVKRRKGRHCALVADGRLRAALAGEKFEVFSDIDSLIEEIERGTATAPLQQEATETVPVPLDQLRAPFNELDMIVLGINEALNSPDKERLFSILESVGINRELAEHEARTLTLLKVLTDTGTHLIPTKRAMAMQAAGEPAVQALLLKALG
jgi:predicted nucleic acid-binding protein